MHPEQFLQLLAAEREEALRRAPRLPTAGAGPRPGGGRRSREGARRPRRVGRAGEETRPDPAAPTDRPGGRRERRRRGGRGRRP